MSLNHIQTLISDDEAFDVKFKDVYCDNVYSNNDPVSTTSTYKRKYQQFSEVTVGGNTETSILDATSSIGDFSLSDYNVGTRYEFSTDGDFSTQSANKELTIKVMIGPLVVFASILTIPHTVGGHNLTGYLLTEQVGSAGVARLSGSFVTKFNSSSGDNTEYISNFLNGVDYQTVNPENLNITVQWTDVTGHSITYRNFKLDRVG